MILSLSSSHHLGRKSVDVANYKFSLRRCTRTRIGGKRGGAKVKRYFFLTNIYIYSGPLRASAGALFNRIAFNLVAGGRVSFSEII